MIIGSLLKKINKKKKTDVIIRTKTQSVLFCWFLKMFILIIY